MYRVCLVMVAVLGAEAGLFGGAFFCRDPDTGKLHAINSTWRSTSFCGNYHCRLRRKNLTLTQYAPMRQINVSSVNLGYPVDRKKYLYNHNKANIKKENIDVVGINNLIKNDITNVSHEDPILQLRPKLLDGDRYLSEQEIELISAILHTVTKNDLDAIIEIFNLAQDLYNEIDKANPTKLAHETDIDLTQSSNIGNKNEQVSYWYEPINHGKQRDIVAKTPTVKTMTSSSALTHSTTLKPIKLPFDLLQNYPTTNAGRSYSDGPRTSNNPYEKLQFFYSPSSLQRQSSYVHTPVDSVYTPTVPTKTTIPKVERGKLQNDIKPSIFLPYPFSHIHPYYNWTVPQTIYYKHHYVDRLNPKRGRYSKVETPGISKKYLERDTNQKYQHSRDENVDNAVLVNPYLENYHDADLKIVEEEKEVKDLASLTLDKRLDEDYKNTWEMDALSKQIMEDVSINIENTRFLKPFYIKNKIKLEDDMVTKLVELNMRSKRRASIFEPELYEVYIEKTTCQTDDTVPGFFRYGNISQPYPDCCPQRIS